VLRGCSSVLGMTLRRWAYLSMAVLQRQVILNTSMKGYFIARIIQTGGASRGYVPCCMLLRPPGSQS
jgi:hypothetical protein